MIVYCWHDADAENIILYACMKSMTRLPSHSIFYSIHTWACRVLITWCCWMIQWKLRRNNLLPMCWNNPIHSFKCWMSDTGWMYWLRNRVDCCKLCVIQCGYWLLLWVKQLMLPNLYWLINSLQLARILSSAHCCSISLSVKQPSSISKHVSRIDASNVCSVV